MKSCLKNSNFAGKGQPTFHINHLDNVCYNRGTCFWNGFGNVKFLYHLSRKFATNFVFKHFMSIAVWSSCLNWTVANNFSWILLTMATLHYAHVAADAATSYQVDEVKQSLTDMTVRPVSATTTTTTTTTDILSYKIAGLNTSRYYR